MTEVVLDASALIALLNQERGWEEVAATIPGAAISTVNLSEVVAKLMEAGMPEGAAREAVESVELDIHPFDLPSAYRTGALRLETKSFGLGLGDRACLALGQSLGRPVVTADRHWRELTVGVEIRVVR
jgi:PIN domain nuclease of toxin-antitoxin system